MVVQSTSGVSLGPWHLTRNGLKDAAIRNPKGTRVVVTSLGAARGVGRSKRPGKGTLESAGADSNRLKVPRPTYRFINLIRFALRRPFPNLTLQPALPTNTSRPAGVHTLPLLSPSVNPESRSLFHNTSKFPRNIGMMTDWAPRRGTRVLDVNDGQSAIAEQLGRSNPLQRSHEHSLPDKQ